MTLTKYTDLKEFFENNTNAYYAYPCENCKGVIEYATVDFFCPFCGHPTPDTVAVAERNMENKNGE